MEVEELEDKARLGIKVVTLDSEFLPHQGVPGIPCTNWIVFQQCIHKTGTGIEDFQHDNIPKKKKQWTICSSRSISKRPTKEKPQDNM